MKQIDIQTSGGYALAATEFAPAQENGQVVQINSAAGVKQQFYYNFAQFLAASGYYVYTYDYCGIGLSKPPVLKACRATFRSWAQTDYPAMVEHLKDWHPTKKLHLIGHSFGGNCLGLSNVSNEFESIVTIAAQHGYWKNFPVHKQWQMQLLFRFVMPATSSLLGYFPSQRFGLGENLPQGVAFDWSKIILDERSLVALTDGVIDYYPQINRKMLMLSVEDDWMASRTAVDALARHIYQNADITRKHISPAEAGVAAIGHLNFFRKKFEPTLWRIPLEWLRQIHKTA